MECRTLGESKGNFTNSSVRQMKQRETTPDMDNNSSNGAAKLAVGLLAGASVGVLAGMLLAPEKGRDARKKVADTASRFGSQVSSSFTSTKERLNSWTAAKQDKTKVHRSPYEDLNTHHDTMVNTRSSGAIVREGEGNSTGLPGMLK